MNKVSVLKTLAEKYPNKNVVCIPDENPSEIICEVDPTKDHTDHNLAVAIIDKSAPHFHKESTETYKIIEGELDLFVEDVKHHLSEGDSYIVEPGKVHYAIGNETWIECYSEPGWTLEDHILVKAE